VVESSELRASLRHPDLDVVHAVAVALEPVAKVLKVEDEADLLRLGAVYSHPQLERPPVVAGR
jgi:hypothetical protein